MSDHQCLECGNFFEYEKTLARHVVWNHKKSYSEYMAQHGKTNSVTCHCGNVFENTRYPGGPRQHGRRQIHCSPECVQIATNCRTRGVDTKLYWELQAKGCAICGAFETTAGKRMLAIDHDHQTGKFRGLLCNVCNSHRVGSNSLETALRVVEYLQRSLSTSQTST